MSAIKKGRLSLATGVLALAVCVAGLAWAADGNARKGKYVFRQNCRACHIEGGKAMPLSPDSKTQDQWKRVFAKYGDLKCKDEWNKIAEQDRKDIFAYLYEHAADSPSPAKCK